MIRNLIIIVTGLGLTGTGLAQTNVDATNERTWFENLGWADWRDANGGSAGVRIASRVLDGYVWAENIGWIDVGNGPAAPPYYANATEADYGVNIDTNGMLSGLAWSENVGWINFGAGATASPPQPARMECDGRMNGYAWGENVGWINLSAMETGKYVSIDALSQPYRCDMNHDGQSNGDDVQVFVGVVLTGAAYDWRDLCSGDIAAPPDGQLDASDLAVFVGCLLGN